jgi:CelD/BcsL family acetyltransferase involved in cellulose biosynthesis
MGGVRFDWLESPVEFYRLRDRWDGWLNGWGAGGTFQCWDWLRLWLRTYGADQGLLVGLAHHEGELIGIAPFYRTHEKVTVVGPVLRSIRLLGDGLLCPDHLVLPVAPGKEDLFGQALAAELLARANEWDRIELRDLLADHPAWRSFEAALRVACSLELVVRERTHCPYLPLPSTYEQYLAGCGSKTRGTIRYRTQRVEKAFAIEVKRPTTMAQVDAFMERLEVLHAGAWKRRDRPGVFADPRFQLFHRLHARRAFRTGRLWLLAMCADGREVAISLGFVSGGVVQGYQLGHDTELSEYGIGAQMVVRCIQQAIEDGARELDFLRGSGAYKLKLAKRERRGHDLIVHRDTVADRTARTAEDTRRRIGVLLRETLGRERKDWIKRRIGLH